MLFLRKRKAYSIHCGHSECSKKTICYLIFPHNLCKYAELYQSAFCVLLSSGADFQNLDLATLFQ